MRDLKNQRDGFKLHFSHRTHVILGKIEYYFPSFHSIFHKEDGIYPILGELGSLYNLEFNLKK